MTKVSVFGQKTEVKKTLKPIEFVKCLNDDNSFDDDVINTQPCDWSNVSLITTNHNGVGMDLMLAWDSNKVSKFGCPDGGTLYLGHLNDGIV